jgi:hypothetical protein
MFCGVVMMFCGVAMMICDVLQYRRYIYCGHLQL